MTKFKNEDERIRYKIRGIFTFLEHNYADTKSKSVLISVIKVIVRVFKGPAKSKTLHIMFKYYEW